jgi:DNA polymerase (family 10)
LAPKKIRVIWQDLGVESAGELLYAVNENRLIDLKGFGPKTQSDLKKKLEYFLRSRHQYHFASLEGEAEQLLLSIQQQQPELRCEWTGAIRRKSITLEQIELLVEQHPHLESLLAAAGVTELQQQEGQWQGRSPHDIPLVIYPVAPEDF